MSALKSEVDDAKGRTLDDMSEMVSARPRGFLPVGWKAGVFMFVRFSVKHSHFHFCVLFCFFICLSQSLLNFCSLVRLLNV